MNLVDQIFQQAQLGTSQTPNANPFLEGVQVGQQQQRINLATQQFAMEAAQFQVKQTLMQQEAQMNAYKLQTMKDKRDALVTGYQDMANLAGQVNAHFAAGEPEKADQAWFETIQKNPRLVGDPDFQQMRQAIDTSMQAKAKLIELKYAQPGVFEVSLPDGTKVPVLRTSAGHYSPLRNPEETAAIKDTEKIEKTKQDLKQALASGNQPEAERLQSYLTTLQERTTPPNETTTTTVDPKTGVTSVVTQRGKPLQEPGALTTAEQTRLGEDLEATSNGLRSLGQLSQGLTGKVVGIGPSITSKVFDDLLSQFAPGLADRERVQGRSLIGMSAQQLIGELNRSGRFSQMELQRIESLLPSTGPLSSAISGQMKVAAISRILSEKGASAAVKLKRPVPTTILAGLANMSNEELFSDAQQGWLDPGVAQQAVTFRKQRQNANTPITNVGRNAPVLNP